MAENQVEITPAEPVNSSQSFNEQSMERFLCVVEKSAKQWQVIVYPSLVAFMVLAAFGFYLIYSLTSDIRTMARSLDPNMGHHMARITDSMQKMTVTINNMSSDMRSLPPMLTHMERLDGSVSSMVGQTQVMAAQTQQMNHSMRAMSYTNERMRYSVAQMSRNTKPMSMFNNFIPF